MTELFVRPSYHNIQSIYTITRKTFSLHVAVKNECKTEEMARERGELQNERGKQTDLDDKHRYGWIYSRSEIMVVLVSRDVPGITRNSALETVLT